METQPSKEYLKGFNQGYLIKENKPELFQQVQSVKTKNDYLLGFRAGGDEYEKTVTKQKGREINLKKPKDLDIDR